MHRIADDQRQRIGEDGRGLLERHAVLAMVRRGLARVPAESHTRKCMTLNDGDDKSRPSRIHGFAASSGGQAIDSVSRWLACTAYRSFRSASRVTIAPVAVSPRVAHPAANEPRSRLTRPTT